MLGRLEFYIPNHTKHKMKSSLATMISLLIIKLHKKQPLILRLVFFFPNIYYEHVFKTHIGSLSLSIRFRTICTIDTNFGVVQFEQRFPKFTHDLIFIFIFILSQILSHGNPQITNISLTNITSTHEVVTIVIARLNQATIISLRTTT